MKGVYTTNISYPYLKQMILCHYCTLISKLRGTYFYFMQNLYSNLTTEFYLSITIHAELLKGIIRGVWKLPVKVLLISGKGFNLSYNLSKCDFF